MPKATVTSLEREEGWKGPEASNWGGGGSHQVIPQNLGYLTPSLQLALALLGKVNDSLFVT